MMLSLAARTVVCGVGAVGGVIGIFTAVVCSLLCSSTYLAESDSALQIIIVLFFYIGPPVGLAGAIMVWLGKRMGATLMVTAGICMAYSYGLGNMWGVFLSAMPLVVAGLSLFILAARREADSTEGR